FAGFVWFNAGYWFRREELGERHRLGWKVWSLVLGLGISTLSAWWASDRDFGSVRALPTDPTVVVITVDTLRRDHVSIHGESPVQTPNLDALARDGETFTDTITPLPETAPAHAALWTGLHPVRTGVLSNGHRLPRGFRTLAEALADEGYATGAFVSSFAVDSRTGLDQGFEVYDDDFFPWIRGVSDVLVCRLVLRLVMRFGDPLTIPWLLERAAPDTYERALTFLEQTRDGPSLLWVHLFEPHAPYEPHGLAGFEDNGTPAEPSLDHRWILANEEDFTYTDEVRERLRRLYQEEVAYTDQQLGVFFEAVEALELDRDLLIVVTADHGEMLGEHGVEFNHHGLWEDVIRVPLVIVPHRVT
ncbi:MAG: sulfatase, partial [Myxococcota bacterium]|nr:sulfatase [Myxococcota bacterium]